MAAGRLATRWRAGDRALEGEPSPARRRRPAARRCGARCEGTRASTIQSASCSTASSSTGRITAARSHCCEEGPIARHRRRESRVFQDAPTSSAAGSRRITPPSVSCWSVSTRKASGEIGISYKEAVDEALCFGWIDGIKKRVDDRRYTHRFTPRTTQSIWSVINTRRVAELIALKRMAKPGLEAFRAARSEEDRTSTRSRTGRPRSTRRSSARSRRRNRRGRSFARSRRVISVS